MSDAIKCISCSAVSYNEYGETALHCGWCYKQLKLKIESLESRLAEALERNVKLEDDLKESKYVSYGKD
jgi:hypothetical protein